jgi:hypothetical protein
VSLPTTPRARRPKNWYDLWLEKTGQLELLVTRKKNAAAMRKRKAQAAQNYKDSPKGYEDRAKWNKK